MGEYESHANELVEAMRERQKAELMEFQENLLQKQQRPKVTSSPAAGFTPFQSTLTLFFCLSHVFLHHGITPRPSQIDTVFALVFTRTSEPPKDPGTSCQTKRVSTHSPLMVPPASHISAATPKRTRLS